MSSVIFSKSDILGTIFVIFEAHDDELDVIEGLISIGPTVELDDIKNLADELKENNDKAYIINVAEIKSQQFIDTVVNSNSIELIYAFIPPNDINLATVVTDNEVKMLGDASEDATIYSVTVPLFIK